MRFVIISHAVIKQKNNSLFAYEPYVREMNLWLQNVAETKIIAPISKNAISPIDAPFESKNIAIDEIPSFHLIGIKNKISTIFKIPIIVFKIFKAMLWADHIHLRCPGNIGLLGTIVQVFFPSKSKTVKYAGNWDPKSKQPLSYRFQKWILSNTFLTKNCKVLVYGEWKNQSKNIVPFFTASYRKNEIVEIPKKELKEKIHFIYVGAFTEGKQPLLSVKVIEKLKKKGVNVQLDMFGDGKKYELVKNYIEHNHLEKHIVLHGNQPKKIVKKAFQKAHFLVFISKSEGWPKVVAEAMFWGCLPISSKVSCVPYMLEEGKRGSIVNPNIDEVVKEIRSYLEDEKKYQKAVVAAKNWSQQFTLDTFEKEIKKVLFS